MSVEIMTAKELRMYFEKQQRNFEKLQKKIAVLESLMVENSQSIIAYSVLEFSRLVKATDKTIYTWIKKGILKQKASLKNIEVITYKKTKSGYIISIKENKKL
jgi:hypothetical protein